MRLSEPLDCSTTVPPRFHEPWRSQLPPNVTVQAELGLRMNLKANGLPVERTISPSIAIAVATASSVKKLDGATVAILAIRGTTMRGSIVTMFGGSLSRSPFNLAWAPVASLRNSRLRTPPSLAAIARARRKYQLEVTTKPSARVVIYNGAVPVRTRKRIWSSMTSTGQSARSRSDSPTL